MIVFFLGVLIMQFFLDEHRCHLQGFTILSNNMVNSPAEKLLSIWFIYYDVFLEVKSRLLVPFQLVLQRASTCLCSYLCGWRGTTSPLPSRHLTIVNFLLCPSYRILLYFFNYSLFGMVGLFWLATCPAPGFEANHNVIEQWYQYHNTEKAQCWLLIIPQRGAWTRHMLGHPWTLYPLPSWSVS